MRSRSAMFFKGGSFGSLFGDFGFFFFISDLYFVAILSCCSSSLGTKGAHLFRDIETLMFCLLPILFYPSFVFRLFDELVIEISIHKFLVTNDQFPVFLLHG